MQIRPKKCILHNLPSKKGLFADPNYVPIYYYFHLKNECNPTQFTRACLLMLIVVLKLTYVVQVIVPNDILQVDGPLSLKCHENSASFLVPNATEISPHFILCPFR